MQKIFNIVNLQTLNCFFYVLCHSSVCEIVFKYFDVILFNFQVNEGLHWDDVGQKCQNILP
jgi:hypothetical protein